MAKKQLTRTLDTSTAEGQEAALRLLQQATEIKAPSTAPILSTVIAPIVENAVQTEAPPQYIEPKKSPKSKVEKRGRPAKGDLNEGGSIKLIADGSSVKRINMDFPLDMYERIESEIDETGQTVKGFFLMLAKQYFKNRNSAPSV